MVAVQQLQRKEKNATLETVNLKWSSEIKQKEVHFLTENKSTVFDPVSFSRVSGPVQPGAHVKAHALRFRRDPQLKFSAP